MDDFFLEWLIGAIVWTFANVLYVDLRRKGTRRGRLLSFVVGYPGTLISYLLVQEARVPPIEQPDDEDVLMREILIDRDRRLRASEGGETNDGEPGAPPGT